MKKSLFIFALLFLPHNLCAESLSAQTSLSFIGQDIKPLSAETALQFIGREQGPLSVDTRLRFIGKGAGNEITVLPVPPLVMGGSAGGTVAGEGDVLDINLVQARPRGGVIPFRVSDVRNSINPQAILASSTTSNNGNGGNGGSGGGGSGGGNTITCPSGTQHPSSGFASNIEMTIPATTGSCSLVAGPSFSNDVAFEVTSFFSVSATITGQNGWTVSVSSLNVGFSVPANNTFTVSKGGKTYSITLAVLTDTIGGGKITITNFATVP